MLDLVLYEPEIPPNTGNLIRLAANSGMRLHLVKPYGFHFDDKTLARAGLDYHDIAAVTQHFDWSTCRGYFDRRRLFAVTTKAAQRYDQPRFRPDDVLVFGPETRGLPRSVLDEFEPNRQLRVPMQTGRRCLNLSNAAAIVAYEAWRQLDFAGGS